MNLSLKRKKKLNEILFIFWAGGAALLSYMLVYALRKPYTAATFEGLELWGFDYKVVVTTIQLVGYFIAKFVGIKVISEMKPANRFRFFVGSVILAELSLVLFGALPLGLNFIGIFINGLSLGCMWGVIFSFIEGRKVTDILASILGVSIVLSSGMAKSFGLFAMNDMGISAFWMPAVVGGVALPILILLGYLLKRLPAPTAEDVKLRSKRVELDGKARMNIFRRYAPIIIVALAANLILCILRDIKEDFLVNIIDMEGQSSWLFAKIDTVVTISVLILLSLFTLFKNNYRALLVMMVMVTISSVVMSYVSFFHESLALGTITWLMVQSISLYVGYLTFQTIFFDRFISHFRIKGNIGFFVAMGDFIGYLGTVIFLFTKELLQIKTDWFVLYNNIAFTVGLISIALFAVGIYFLVMQHRRSKQKSSSELISEQIIEINYPTQNLVLENE